MNISNVIKSSVLSLALIVSTANAGLIEQWDFDFEALNNAGSIKSTGAQNYGSIFSATTNELVLSNNAWYYLSLNDAIGYSTLDENSSSANFVLSFDLSFTGNMTEVGGLQFSTSVNPIFDQTFNIFGTQTWGRREFAYSGTGVQHFEMNLRELLTTNIGFKNILFINDCDSAACASDNKLSFSNVSIKSIPEPASIAIFALGLFGMAATRRKFNR